MKMSIDDNNGNDLTRRGEPSVLDWLKSLLRGKPISIPEAGDALRVEAVPEPPAEDQRTVAERMILVGVIILSQFRLPAAIFLSLVAQYLLENYREDTRLAILLYIVAGGLTVWALWKRDFKVKHPGMVKTPFTQLGFRPTYLIIALITAALTFLSSGNNLFDLPTVFLWMLSMVTIVMAFWEGELLSFHWVKRIKMWIENKEYVIKFSRWTLLVVAVFGLTLFFRFYRLDQVPPEMVSDHAEKLLDVVDVLNGFPSIFFSRNTGREALQFYMAAATVKILGTGISHLTLKIGTALAGVVTLIYIYFIGKELSSRRVGLFAMLLAGVAYWPNVISRVGLRFPLYPLFVAPVFYYLIRGIQRRNRNDFILCGLFIGVGLHGYSPARVIPIAVVLGLALFLLHRASRENRKQLIILLVVTGVIATVVAMPLIRVAFDRPDEIIYRMATRYGSSERPLPGPAWQIFLSNVWNGLRMFAWDNGEVWVNSIPHRPALDWLTATFFHLGVVIVAVRYIRERHWIDLFLLLSIPILQLPSTLSLAFPAENPATNRAAGAIIPVFLIAGLAFDSIPRWLKQQWEDARMERYGLFLVTVLFYIVSRINYDLVFIEYQDLYRQSAWNTSEAGQVIRSYAESIGSYEKAYVVAFPHWVDTRLVAMNAGIPTVDYAISREQLETLPERPGPHLLLLHPDDEESLAILFDLFPEMNIRHWPNEIPGKDFVIAFAPGTSEIPELPDQSE
jgi:hypothetical protein